MGSFVCEAVGLTSDVFEVDGLSVWVQKLDDRVVVVLHSAADCCHFPLNHRHIVRCQILTFNFITQTEKTDSVFSILGRRQASLPGYHQSLKY